MIRLGFLIITLAPLICWSVQARADALSFERYYIKKYPCETDDIASTECQKRTAHGGLWKFHGIGIVRRGVRVCGIAHFSSYQKTDVTRFVGTISGNVAEIQFSSSHDLEKVATGTIVLTPKSAKWLPNTVEWSGGGGYHSSPFVAPRGKKPDKKQSYIVEAKRECEEFLSNGTPFEKLGSDF